MNPVNSGRDVRDDSTINVVVAIIIIIIIADNSAALRGLVRVSSRLA